MEETLTSDTPQETASKKRPYWFGYLYAAFWAFVTYSCVTHTVVTIQLLFAGMGSHAPLADQIKMELIMGAFLWPAATLLFGWVTYRLLVRRVSMKMIYMLITFHAANVLFSGAAPYLVAFWVLLTAIVTTKFKEFLRLTKA